jgi:YfiH family protein
MEWHEVDEISWLEAELPRSKAVFSTRSAGSAKEDHVPLAAALGISPERIVSGEQVHGAELAFHPADDAGRGTADGQVIVEPGPVGMVYVADCLPVALAGLGGVAILHCGWRGLAAGIVARGTEAVGATHAAIGPGIGPCCYQVGDEVLDAFAGLGGGEIAAGRMLDLPAVARLLLRDAGVAEVECAELCTRCEPELFFSHRRDSDSRRQAGLVWMDAGEA